MKTQIDVSSMTHLRREQLVAGLEHQNSAYRDGTATLVDGKLYA
jgi:hypothetical protein